RYAGWGRNVGFYSAAGPGQGHLFCGVRLTFVPGSPAGAFPPASRGDTGNYSILICAVLISSAICLESASRKATNSSMVWITGAEPASRSFSFISAVLACLTISALSRSRISLGVPVGAQRLNQIGASALG